MATTRPNGAEDLKNTPSAPPSQARAGFARDRVRSRRLFGTNSLSIGRRLTVCFLSILVSMIAADAVVFWHFTQIVASNRRLSNADQISLAIVRLRLDVGTFRKNVAALESSHQTEQFSADAAGLRQSFFQDVEDARQALGKAPDIARKDPTIPAALEALKATLPSQLDAAVQLATAGDWNAIRLRLDHQIQDLIDLSSSLVKRMDQQAQQQRAKAIEDAERAQQGFFVMVTVAGLLTFILAALAGWYATQSITVPLADLASGAQALARGDFSHQVSVYGNDELSAVGRAFNHAARQLQELYDALRHSNRELQAISNCNQVLLRATDEQSLVEEICRIVCEGAGYRMAFVAFAEHDEAKSVRPVAWTGAEEGYLATAGLTWADTERGRGPTGTAIRSGKTCCIQDLATDPRVAPWRESALQRDFRSGVGLPLKDEHGNAFGSLTIYSAQPNAFTSEEVRMLDELAGDLAFGIVTLRSAAARKQAEQEVTLLTFALDRVRESVFLIDDSGRFRYVNEDTCRVLCYPRAELLGLGVSDIDPDFPAERWSGHWRDLKAQGSMSFESHHRTRDGRTFPVEINAKYFEYAGQAYALALARDITDRKRAEEALRRSEAYLAEAQRLSKTASWAYNPNTEYIYWSEELFRIFGLDPHQPPLDYEAVAQRMHPDDRQRTLERRQKAMHDGTDYVDDYRTILPDGTIKHLHVIGHPVLNEAGELLEFVGTTIDVTERKRAEEATLEARVSERTRIARELHDTLLQSFHGLLLRFQAVWQLLPDRPIEAKKTLDSAIQQAADAITEGRDAVQALRESTVQGNDLAQAISNLGEELANTTNEPPVAFHVSVEGESRNLHPIIRDEIYKISAEALRNAFRHADAKQIAVAVHYEDEQVRLRVCDDGKGIDREVLSRKAGEGHYGIAGMRERATIIGGNVELRSEVGRGTEVELCVPASKAYATSERSSCLSGRLSEPHR